ncbi:sigma-70 family RNA polymerase sigma factor [Granulicella sp. WH15]|uniref:RNA polymerase sigma factor n=1 Tax=Granulicella sp. WH15 TaxID=2602070 RepID=UPI0013678E6E|nr:sigma-70 family RNA polymerase sigma factor [Granulicella sp. WH15]QHN05021.1 sigma-70 family RNA polymerase sigma factor [Granulicella sp. WH15]
MTPIVLHPASLAEPEFPLPGAAGQVAPPAVQIEDIEALHALYEPRIFRFLYASLRDHDLAQTLTQDTFLRAWTARATFRGDSSISTWLTTIALNLLRDHTRTNRFRFWKNVASTQVDPQEMAGQLAHPASSTEQRLIAREQLALVWQTVATLSERQRTVFLLRFVEEQPIGEIAVITGLPVSTVKSHLYRAIAAVRARQPQIGVQAGVQTDGQAPTKDSL